MARRKKVSAVHVGKKHHKKGRKKGHSKKHTMVKA